MGAILSTCAHSVGVVSRNGGEEFSVLLPNRTHNAALEISELIRASVEKHQFLLPNGKELQLTISVGVATYLETTDQAEHLLKEADDALYVAKRTGRNKVCSLNEG